MHKQAAQVLARLATEPAGWTRERLHAVKLGLESQMDLDEIATALGRARSVIQEWFNFYREGGIERLLEVRRGKGPPSRLSAEALAALTKGLEEGRCRTTAQAQAQAFLAKEHAAGVVPGTQPRGATLGPSARALANELHANLEALEQALTRALIPFWEDANRVCSLIGKGWLLTQANVTGMGVLPV